MTAFPSHMLTAIGGNCKRCGFLMATHTSRGCPAGAVSSYGTLDGPVTTGNPILSEDRPTASFEAVEADVRRVLRGLNEGTHAGPAFRAVKQEELLSVLRRHWFRRDKS